MLIRQYRHGLLLLQLFQAPKNQNAQFRKPALAGHLTAASSSAAECLKKQKKRLTVLQTGKLAGRKTGLHTEEVDRKLTNKR